jgi:hypothetical protein
LVQITNGTTTSIPYTINGRLVQFANINLGPSQMTRLIVASADKRLRTEMDATLFARAH